jgi:hypothetical protein
VTNKRDLMIVVLATFCLTATLFMVTSTRSQTPSASLTTSANYDAMADINHDGHVDILDAILLANVFGSSGDPTLNVTVINIPPNQIVPRPYYIYSVPFAVSTNTYTIHPSPIGLGPGVYETDILVHNPDYVNATIYKKIAVALPEGQTPPKPIEIGQLILLSDYSFRIDSDEIWAYSMPYQQITNTTKGFICIVSNTALLDVTVFYTVSDINTSNSFYNVGNTTSIESMTIPPKSYYGPIPPA